MLAMQKQRRTSEFNYVEWHMRAAWRALLFADEDLKRKSRRDPVAAALTKIARRTLEDGSPVHSFRTLLHDLSTLVRNTCQTQAAQHAGATFLMTTLPSPAQHRALQLLQSITL